MAIISLSIYVGNLSVVAGLFDQIQVFRSEDGEDGEYAELTAASVASAILLGTEEAPFTLDGLTLLVRVDGEAEQTITFVSTDPINADDTVDFINANITGATATEEDGAIRLSSDTTGTSSLLEITGGTALTALGFVQDAKDNGEDARITLVVEQEDYTYEDLSGDPDYFYRTRYYNSGSEAVSSFSDPIQGDIGSIVSSGSLIKGVMDLATVDGAPVEERRITFHPVYIPTALIVDYVGIVRGDIEVYTDTAGHAEVLLVKGTTVDVTISGTGITRRIEIPSTGTAFDVLGAIAAADDVYQIQVPNIPAAVRRT